MNTDQIDADMMQIDSILKALNSGTFDQGNMMAIDHLTDKKPKNTISNVQLGPSTGLSLISQLTYDDSSSSSDDSDCSSDDDSIDERRGQRIEPEKEGGDSDESDSNEYRNKSKDTTHKHGYPMVKGEVDYRDLPPPEVTSEECPSSIRLTAVGLVKSITEKLIIIESITDLPPMDEGTVLWNSQRHSLGTLFEIFGPVKKPFYSIRVSEGEVLVSQGDEIHAALDDSSFTKYAFMQDIVGQKGSDASWRYDEEVPDELQDYSDDEKEMLAKQKIRNSKRQSNAESNCTIDENSPSPSGHHQSSSGQIYPVNHPPPTPPLLSTPPKPQPRGITHNHYPLPAPTAPPGYHPSHTPPVTDYYNNGNTMLPPLPPPTTQYIPPTPPPLYPPSIPQYPPPPAPDILPSLYHPDVRPPYPPPDIPPPPPLYPPDIPPPAMYPPDIPPPPPLYPHTPPPVPQPPIPWGSHEHPHPPVNNDYY